MIAIDIALEEIPTKFLTTLIIMELLMKVTMDIKWLNKDATRSKNQENSTKKSTTTLFKILKT